ncbi:FemAB family XrtA/PEP-CTERM system-associated protein [Thalassotalea eurytherma]|uniref:BioF2-like acetyltransferase domain-containing protein n=1 Tax=Thalassotalea eurytherma TaxID=1144278 RepID=A0ABQ6H1T0_9GAMM|nr:FemAB family XrtA/PEP-CTERM system-associated protein [Thalassotalea eurytherma]GLX82110.1 hypothetical protein theurythT_15620 [Thalassotalea eurytherma]
MEVIFASSSNHNSWDEYVSNNANASAYHQWAWLATVEQAYKFSVYRLMAIENGKTVGVFPLAYIKKPFMAGKLSSLPYCDLGGVLADSDEIKQQLLAEAFKLGAEKSIAKIEYRTHAARDREPSTLQKVRMVLPLPSSSEELMQSFKSKLRSQIRKATKNGLTASTGNDKAHLDGFYQVYCKNMRDLGSPAHSFQWFQSIVENYKENAVIANVYFKGEVIGAGLILVNNQACVIPWASTNGDYNKLAPNMLLYWTLLSYASDNGITSFDFGRSTPGEGTYKFKAQWGAQPQGLDWYDFYQGKPVIESAGVGNNRLRPLIEKLWCKLPVGVATGMGSSLRKYISL